MTKEEVDRLIEQAIKDQQAQRDARGPNPLTEPVKTYPEGKKG
jgi:hypothetical protein